MAGEPRPPTLYEVLGLAPGASDEDIKRNYYALARKFHPDRNQGNPAAEASFKAVARAFEVLSDPGKRAQYDDALRADPDTAPRMGQSGARAAAPVGSRREAITLAIFGVLLVLAVLFFFFDTAKGIYFLVVAVALEIRASIESLRAEVRASRGR